MPAKFLVGSRRPCSLRSLSRAHISSQNVTSANNYGIVKAGDGGNGGRGFDGVGGSDKTDGTAPTTGIIGGSEGEQGKPGSAYVALQDDTLSKCSNALKSEIGKKGKKGNSGWGGLNLSENLIDEKELVGLSYLHWEFYANAGVAQEQQTEAGKYKNCGFEIKRHKGPGGSYRHYYINDNHMVFESSKDTEWKDGYGQGFIDVNGKFIYKWEKVYFYFFTKYTGNASKYKAFIYVYGGIVDGKISPWEG